MTRIVKYYKTPVVMTGVLFLLLLMTNACAQQMDVQNDNVLRKVTMYNLDGKLFSNPYIDVAGNPFFLEAWKYGKIETNENSVFSNLLFRVDLLTQEVHFKKPDSVEMVAPRGLVKKITLFDTVGGLPTTYIFQCGFPSIDNQNEKNLYQLLSDGKIKLLKDSRKTIYQEKDNFSGAVQKEFRQYEDYYFFIQGESVLRRFKRDKKNVLDFMKDKNDKIEAFLQTNKISFKSTDDIKKLVDYYNSLF